MARRPRTLLKGYHLVEITNRTVQGRFLFRPSRELNRIIHGALGRAQRVHGGRIHAYVFLSNHFHILVSFDSAEQMAAFMRDFQAKLAKEVCRLSRWKDQVLARRYSVVPVDPSEASQVARLCYLLSNGCKEGLVASPLDWPGASSVAALRDGKSEILGVWIDRTAARRSRGAFDSDSFRLREKVVLSPLPCWSHLPEKERQRRIIELIDNVKKASKVRTKHTGERPMGRRRILRLHPHSTPKELRKRPKPLIHAVTSQARETFKMAYRMFELAYRTAADALKNGDTETVFPPGCFLPSGGFVPGR